MVKARGMLVFDMDGVLVEVSESYRESIVQTVKHFTGKQISRELIQDYKNSGGWNNDWALSQKIAADMGVEVPYATVVEEFQKLFFGHEGLPGLILREVWIPQPGLMERLAERYHFSIFTGRERGEAQVTLDRFVPSLHFDMMVPADEVERQKPDPEGLLKIRAAYPDLDTYYIGDTVDDARSAEAAEVPFIGIAAPGNSRYGQLVELLKQHGAIAVLDDINQLETVLPR